MPTHNGFYSEQAGLVRDDYKQLDFVSLCSFKSSHVAGSALPLGEI